MIQYVMTNDIIVTMYYMFIALRIIHMILHMFSQKLSCLHHSLKPKDYQRLPLFKLEPGQVVYPNQVFWLAIDNSFS
jgi:hypothetical protein